MKEQPSLTAQARRLLQGQGVLVVMPTYMEADNIEQTVGQVLLNYPLISVLVVDDASPDGTGELADRLAASNPRVKVIHRQGPRGLGPAYVRGFTWGLDHQFQVICEMDMDGSHRPQDLKRLLWVLAQSPQTDLVVGSRRVRAGRTVGWPYYRDLISRVGSLYARCVLRLPVRDVTAGFRAYRSPVLKAVRLSSVQSSGYVFQIDMLRRVIAAGGKVVEVPIVFVERAHGSSKMGLSIVLEAMSRVSYWGLEELVHQLRTRKGSS